MSKDLGRCSEENLKFFSFWEVWPKRLKTHFLFCTSLYFALVFRFLWGFWRYANQLFRFIFDNFMAFWKIRFSKKIKILCCWFLEIFLTIFLNSEKNHNLVNFCMLSIHWPKPLNWPMKSKIKIFKEEKMCFPPYMDHNS